MAMMAGLVKAPSRYSPINNLHRAKNRQTYVLGQMTDLGFITQEQTGLTPIGAVPESLFQFSLFYRITLYGEFYGKEKLIRGSDLYNLDLSPSKSRSGPSSRIENSIIGRGFGVPSEPFPLMK
jgi:hypothetical protein